MNKGMKKGIKEVIIAALIVFLVILFLMSTALLCLFVKVKGEEKNIVNVPIDLSQVRDGEYEGHSETTLVKVDIKVVVEGGNIQDIQLIRHVCGKGEPANAMLDMFIVKYNYRKLQMRIGECCISKLEKVAKHSLKTLRNGVAPEW